MGVDRVVRRRESLASGWITSDWITSDWRERVGAEDEALRYVRLIKGTARRDVDAADDAEARGRKIDIIVLVSGC